MISPAVLELDKITSLHPDRTNIEVRSEGVKFERCGRRPAAVKKAAMRDPVFLLNLAALNAEDNQIPALKSNMKCEF